MQYASAVDGNHPEQTVNTSGSGRETRTAKDYLRAWCQASRPAYFIATLIPVVLGWMMAWKDTGILKTGSFILIAVACFLLHLAANLSNDLFDHLQGVDNENSIGGSGVIQEGLISIKAYIRALVLLYAVTVGIAAFGIWHTGLWGIALIICFAIFASFFYVAPPIKLGYRGLGEVLVFLAMGLGMVAGTYYTLAGGLSERALLFSMPIGVMVAGIMYFQSIPEIVTDKDAGKRTLSNTLGPRWAVNAFIAWWPLVWLMLAALFAFGYCGWFVFVGIAVSIPLHLKAVTLTLKAQASLNWPALDPHGHLIRKMYMASGVALIVALFV